MPKAQKSAAQAAARNTGSAPSSKALSSMPPDNDPSDPALRKLAETGALVAAMPYNATKAGEPGFANGAAPPQGASVKPESRLSGGSTLSEENSSDKTGSVAPAGVNAAIEPLDRVRVDSSGRMLTTNQIGRAHV